MNTRRQSYIETAVTLIALVALWQLVVLVFRLPEYILPAPATVFEYLFFPRANANYNWFRHTQATVIEVGVAFLVTAFMGTLISVAISWSRTVRELSMPGLIFLNSLPIVALAPIILLWFGYGLGTNILIGFLVAFFPLVINITKGLGQVEPDLVELVEYMGARKWQVYLKIRFPKALPYFFSGLKISSTMVVVGAIVGEFIASDRGLGFIIVNAQYTMDTPAIFGALILVSLLGAGLFGLVGFLEWLAMPWRR